jgi:sporulation protein YlmC with PRC-barrel domain
MGKHQVSASNEVSLNELKGMNELAKTGVDLDKVKEVMIDKVKAPAKGTVVVPVENEAVKAEKAARLIVITDEIVQAQQSFWVIAKGVFEIEDRHLWNNEKHPTRAGDYASLAEYTADKFEFSGSETTRFFQGGKVLQVLEARHVSVLPKNESQTRQLWRVLKFRKSDEDAVRLKKEEKLVKVWEKVLAQKGKPTAEQIEIVGRLKPSKKTSKVALKGRAMRAPAPIEIVASGTSKADIEKLENALTTKPVKSGDSYTFAPKRRNFKLILEKVSTWFLAEGSRSIDIHLVK